MVILYYIILGIVQGIAEILPISSSGHLALTQILILNTTSFTQFAADSKEMMVFNIFTHFASLLALIIFFHKLIWKMLKGTWFVIFNTPTGRTMRKELKELRDASLFDLALAKEETNSSTKITELDQEIIKTKLDYKNARKAAHKDATKEYYDGFMLTVYMIVASIPVGIVGVLFDDQISKIFGTLLVVGIGFILTGLILLFVSLFTKKSASDKYTWKNTMITGAFQMFGILPGISRSGITMSGAKIAGLSDNKAKEFAFVLFMPAAAGSFLLSLGDFRLIAELGNLDIIGFTLGFGFAFAVTLVMLLVIFKKINLSHYKYFTIYLFVVGLFTIIYSIVS